MYSKVVGVTMALLAVAMPMPLAGRQAPQGVQISASVERDVRYGWVSGLALLMDVYRPTPNNGRGVVVIPGSGWSTGTGYNAPPNTELAARRTNVYVDYFLAGGYTVFIPNVRMTPRFMYPDPVLDAQRAVRFIRSSASRYAIDPNRLGAFGASSGGHLASLLGLLDGSGSTSADDPVEGQSGRVQAVATIMGAFDLTTQPTEQGARAIGGLVGTPLDDPAVQKRRREASPIAHVTSGAAPMLLIHGDADDVVPVAHSQAMEQALLKAGVDTKLVIVPGAGHGGEVMDQQVGTLMPQVVAWFDRYLGVSR